MQISERALALACGAILGGVMLVISGLGYAFDGYADDFLEAIAELHPGFGEEGIFRNVIVGTAWGLGDGLLGGWVLAKAYNFFLKR